MKNQTAISRVAAFLFALCLVFCSAHSAFAVGGNGDGTGGGKDQPLVLASSSIANGAENVALNPKIVLTFSKNVVHFTVRDNNKTCFSMTDEGGSAVPIHVEMGDDQVDPSIKRIVTIVPQSTLTPGTTYLLKIGGGITSKSGASIGKDSYISFTTEGEKPAATTKPTTTKPTTTKPTTTKPPTTKPPTTKPTTTKPTTTKPTTTKPTTTKPATTKPTTTAPTVTVPAATVESTATPAAPTTEVFEVLTDDAEEESTEAADGVEAPQEAAAADDSALALEAFLQNDEPSSTTSAAVSAIRTADAAVSDDMQRAFQNLRLYLLILGISIIAVLAVILIIKLKNHKKG
ncbi:MAG: Ig-like domain-containing protein [Clostridia bacterium]|nr:Ig-like domain-containing protein [Clostridia bacterium]